MSNEARYIAQDFLLEYLQREPEYIDIAEFTTEAVDEMGIPEHCIRNVHTQEGLDLLVERVYEVIAEELEIILKNYKRSI